MTAANRNHLCFAVFLLLIGSAFLFPRLAAGNQKGFASSTTAAVTFLGFFAGAAVLGVVLLVMTLRNRTTLSSGAMITGFLPLPLLAAGLIIVVLLALQKHREQQQSEPTPKTLTPTAVPTSP